MARNGAFSRARSAIRPSSEAAALDREAGRVVGLDGYPNPAKLWKRLGYAMSRVAIARTYDGHDTINLAGLGGKAGSQAVSTLYYPSGSETFGVLATKFAYSVARDMGFTVFREFYPDIAIHVLHRNP